MADDQDDLDLLKVEVVRHKIAAIRESEQAGLVHRAIHDSNRRESVAYVRRFGAALAKYDEAFIAYRRRVRAHRLESR